MKNMAAEALRCVKGGRIALNAFWKTWAINLVQNTALNVSI